MSLKHQLANLQSKADAAISGLTNLIERAEAELSSSKAEVERLPCVPIEMSSNHAELEQLRHENKRLKAQEVQNGNAHRTHANLMREFVLPQYGGAAEYAFIAGVSREWRG